MIYVKLEGQLGNQMFAYASLRAIASKNNYDFRFAPRTDTLVNDSDKKYGSEIFQIFSIPREQMISVEEAKLFNFSRIDYSVREECEHNSYYRRAVAECKDNSQLDPMKLMTSVYIKDVLPEVREWFKFPDDIAKKAERVIAELRSAHSGKLCAVHFRVGRDYVRGGFKMAKSYWFNAAKEMQTRFGRDNILFVVFYDVENSCVREFLKCFPAKTVHNSMIVDMCSIGLCDMAILCNSTFSAMSALLSRNPNFFVIRPSRYPVFRRYLPTDAFLPDWHTVASTRAWDAEIIMWVIYFRMVLREGVLRIKKMFGKLKFWI